jgi:hypothetical protein
MAQCCGFSPGDMQGVRMKVVKILKINILALFALPLFLLATAAQMAAKALKKAVAITGIFLIVLAVAAVFEIARDFGQSMEVIMLVIVCIVLGGVFSALIFLMLSLASAVIMAVINVVIGILEGIYSVLYSGYTFLYHKCKTDYEEVREGGTSLLYGLACLIFTIVRLVNRSLILLVTHALKLLAVLSLVIIVGGVYLLHVQVTDVFGMGLLQYMKMFPTFEIVYGVALYVVFVLGISAILISLGLEWNEWGMEMSFSTSHYDAFARNLKDQWQEVRMESVTDTEGDERSRRCKEAMELLENHMESFEDFIGETTPVIDATEDYLLRSDLGEYVGIMQEISERLREYDEGVPMEAFDRIIGKIKEADNLKQSVRKRCEKLRDRQMQSEPVRSFFVGCSTEAKLEKRYKALCKTYHPDNEAGDEETFKAIQAEYETLKDCLGKEGA